MTSTLAARPGTEPALPNLLNGAQLPIEQPPTKVGRLILMLIVLCAIFWGGIGSWAALAPLQSAVVATGSLEVEGNLPSVQHLEGGLVREVRVREGTWVEKGEVVAVLANTYSHAQDRMLINQLVSALAQDQRLGAELARAETLEPTDELAKLIAGNTAFAEMLDAQQDIFSANNEMSLGQAAILTERMGDLHTQLEGLRLRHATLLTRLDMTQNELTDLTKLYESGLITKGRYLNVQEAEIQLLGDVSVMESQLDSVRQRIAEIQQRVLQVRRDRASRLSTQRQVTKERIFDIRQRIVANQDVKDRRLVRSPATGRVLGLNITGPGEVIIEGEELMKIVPDDATFIVQGQVRPQDVDQVGEGDIARVRLTAFNFRTTPPVEGTVVYLSPDSIEDERTGMAYFRVDVRLSKEVLADLPDVKVQPGMPAQIMIATGEHTMADYILGPIMAGLDTAMRESD